MNKTLQSGLAGTGILPMGSLDMVTDDPDKASRKARREERRQKQRETNLGRALKMRAARLAQPKLKSPARKLKTPQIHIGCSGWFYWHWRGQFYAEDLPTKDWFPHYTKNFKTVELNAPFYSWPTVATVQSWLRQIGRRKFVYTVKVSELITHIRQFEDCRELVQDFGLIADVLGERMGCFLFQLPPSFHYSAARLKKILSQLDHTRRNVVEFRHKSWWREDVFAAFKKTGTIFCSCSGPRLPDELVKTADDIYVRFHGTTKWYRHDYSREELEIWADRIRRSKAKNIWVYFNNDRDGYAIKNARMLMRLLKD